MKLWLRGLYPYNRNFGILTHTLLWSLVNFTNDRKPPSDVWKDAEPKTHSMCTTFERLWALGPNPCIFAIISINPSSSIHRVRSVYSELKFPIGNIWYPFSIFFSISFFRSTPNSWRGHLVSGRWFLFSSMYVSCCKYAEPGGLPRHGNNK